MVAWLNEQSSLLRTVKLQVYLVDSKVLVYSFKTKCIVGKILVGRVGTRALYTHTS